jgi:Ca2+-binding EF-hand superfamily protein
MPFAALIPLLLFAAEAPIRVVGHAWAPFISPMGEPFRARTKSDDTLGLWFHQADRNRDGMLTPDEMQADADRFFAKLDRDHNGEIEPEELVAYEWEVAPEIQVNSKRKRLPGQPAEQVKAGDDIGFGDEEPSRHRRANVIEDGLEGGARYALLNLPEPVAAADADFNRAITLAEFRRASQERFRLLDRARAGRLTLPELEALVPPPPKAGRRARRSQDMPDPRIGQPLPHKD